MFADRTQARCSNRRENESQRVRHRREFFDGRALQVVDERGLKSTVAAYKAIILKALSGLFLETAREVGRSYEARLQMDERIVDACAMQLVLNPWQFDVIVTTNLFGDILFDECPVWWAG